MKNIGKISLIAMLLIALSSCGNENKKNEINTQIFTSSGEQLEMESSNEGGGSETVDLLNDSFR